MNTDSVTAVNTMHTHDEFIREYVRAEKAEAELAAHIITYNEEVDQFNEGYDAGEKGGLDPFNDQPHYEPDHDSWRNGYYTGSYDRLTRELAALREQTRWRKFPDEKPPKSDAYLVQSSTIRVAVSYRASFDDGVWNEIEDSDYAGEEITDVVCWTFISELPEEK